MLWTTAAGRSVRIVRGLANHPDQIQALGTGQSDWEKWTITLDASASVTTTLTFSLTCSQTQGIDIDRSMPQTLIRHTHDQGINHALLIHRSIPRNIDSRSFLLPCATVSYLVHLLNVCLWMLYPVFIIIWTRTISWCFLSLVKNLLICNEIVGAIRCKERRHAWSRNGKDMSICVCN